MKILHTSIECYPVAKVGGLADVVGSLPKYQNDFGHLASVVMPFYSNKYTIDKKFEDVSTGAINLGSNSYEFIIKKLDKTVLGFELFLVHIEGLLDRQNVYGYEDDKDQFLAFQLAVLEWILSAQEKPDIIHCHDHHTGLIPFLLSHGKKYESLERTPTVFTIHNAQYQGQISYEKLQCLPEFDHHKIGLLDWDGCINPMATAIKCAWSVTTVSPSYMQELQLHANGLESLLAHESNKCLGILNGIDHETWNPETDPMIIKNYKVTHVVSGRKSNKKWLCDHFNLDLEKPLFGFIGRLVGEKGSDLLPSIIEETLSNTEANFFILGSGHQDTENRLELLKNRFTGCYNAHIGYDEKLSHIVYAGVDFLLMPSRVEPCGLNQMYALRYGLIPIVRRIGGLKDTVIDIGDGGFGICHDHVTIEDVYYSIKRGIELYEDQKKFREFQKQIMKIDNSWNQSAKQYLELYESLILKK